MAVAEHSRAVPGFAPGLGVVAERFCRCGPVCPAHRVLHSRDVTGIARNLAQSGSQLICLPGYRCRPHPNDPGLGSWPNGLGKKNNFVDVSCVTNHGKNGSVSSWPVGSIPKREEPGKTGAPCVKVPGSSRVPLHSPPPPPANSFVIGPAVINTQLSDRSRIAP